MVNECIVMLVINAVWAVLAWRINEGWSKHCKELEAEMYIWKARALIMGE